MFRAVLLENDEAGYRAALADLDDARLPDGDVTVRVDWSTINYKDALAITGRSPIVRSFPFVPGIDLAGTVEASAHPRFGPGDRVVLTGFGVGERHWGGLAERARVSGDWLIALPDGMTAAEAMALGTAGFTAMLAVTALERHGVAPDSGPILVTGAGGGVGGIATHLLGRRGYTVVAATGRPAEADYLHRLGAARVIDRATLAAPGKALGRAEYAGAIDNAGSHTLANICASLLDDGVAIACGLAQGLDFPASVAPFILRGVSLIGVNSVNRPIAEREAAWRRLADEVDRDVLAAMTEIIGLDGAIAAATRALDGVVRGRIVVRCGAE